MSFKKGFDQFQGEPGPDHLSAKTKNIHVIVFHALMGGEHIVYQPGAHAGDFVRGDRCAHSAAAEGDAALHSRARDCPCQWNDEVGIVVSRVEFVRAVVLDLIPRGAQ